MGLWQAYTSLPKRSRIAFGLTGIGFALIAPEVLAQVVVKQPATQPAPGSAAEADPAAAKPAAN